MKTLFTDKVSILLLLCLVNLTRISFAQTGSKTLLSSTDSSYGFTSKNPLPMKRGDRNKSINYTYQFLSELRTKSNQSIKIIERISTTDTYVDNKLILLDEFVLLTSNTSDTIRIFTDIAKKGTVKLPVGLTCK